MSDSAVIKKVKGAELLSRGMIMDMKDERGRWRDGMVSKPGESEEHGSCEREQRHVIEIMTSNKILLYWYCSTIPLVR